MAKTYSKKNQDLREEIVQALIQKSTFSKVESKHTSKTCLVVVDNQVNLDGGRYLAEVTEDGLLDNNGYSYGWDVLNTEELCELADEFLI